MAEGTKNKLEGPDMPTGPQDKGKTGLSRPRARRGNAGIATDLSAEREKLAVRLQEIGAVKFGLFTLKSGLKSPIYIDLRALVSFPDALKMVAKELDNLLQFAKK